MGLFKKKHDPLAQRADSLTRRIAELEAEISKLNHTLTPEAPRPTSPPRSDARATHSTPTSTSASSASPRSPSHEPVFERIQPRPVDGRRPEPSGQAAVDMGLRRPVWSQLWRRVKARWVDPPPTNEKLVSYLAAGGIQGLRPLRYERRVARNRLIFVCVVLGLLLWGLLVVFWQAR